MKGDNLLRSHLAAFDEPDPEEKRATARERLEQAVGRELAHDLLAAFAAARAHADA